MSETSSTPKTDAPDPEASTDVGETPQAAVDESAEGVDAGPTQTASTTSTEATTAAPPPDGQLPNWLEEYLPGAWRPYAFLARWDRPVGIWLLALPCWIGFAFTAIPDGLGANDVVGAVAFFIGAVAMRGAGCTWNDITDRDLDAQVARTAGRPLPSGQVTVLRAWIWLAAQLLVGFLIWLALPLDAKIVALLALPLVFAYPYMKRMTWWPQAWLGATFNFGVLVAAATAGSISLSTIILWLGLACWTIAYDTIYALQDREDDELAGIKSTARLFGDQAVMGAFIFHLVAAVLIALAAMAMGAPQVGAATALAFLAHGGWQSYQMRQNGNGAALDVFRSNIWAGAILTVGFLVAAIV